MKMISKDDLLIIISHLTKQDSFDSDDFEEILDRFGDDYFCDGGVLERTQSSHEMDQIRHLGIKIGFITKVRNLRKKETRND